MPEAASQPNPLSVDDFVVLRKDDLQRLLDAVDDLSSSSSTDGCEHPLFVGDIEHMNAAIEAAGSLKDAKTVTQALRWVDGDADQGNEPVLLVILGKMDDKAAADMISVAVVEANQESDQGRTGTYFEALQERLAAHGVAMSCGLEQLRCKPWDSDEMSEPELNHPDWLEVVLRSSDDEPDELDEVGTIGEDGPQVTIVDKPAHPLFCRLLEIEYPRGDKYGVPEAATERGGRVYVRQISVCVLASDFDVFSRDRGDDGAMTFSMTCRIHKDDLIEVEQNKEQPHER